MRDTSCTRDRLLSRRFSSTEFIPRFGVDKVVHEASDLVPFVSRPAINRFSPREQGSRATVDLRLPAANRRARVPLSGKRRKSPVECKGERKGREKTGEERRRGGGGPNSFEGESRASVLTLNYKCSGFFRLAASAPHTSLARACARARGWRRLASLCSRCSRRRGMSAANGRVLCTLADTRHLHSH